MSQMLLSRPKNTVLYSEMYFPRKTSVLFSSAAEASCHFCKQKIKEGVTLSIRRIGDKSVFVCNIHAV